MHQQELNQLIVHAVAAILNIATNALHTCPDEPPSYRKKDRNAALGASWQFRHV